MTARCPHCGAALEVTLTSADRTTDASAQLAARVLAYIEQNGPCAKRAIRRDVHGGSASIDAALRALEQAGEVVRGDDGIRACQARRARGHSAQEPKPGDLNAFRLEHGASQ